MPRTRLFSPARSGNVLAAAGRQLKEWWLTGEEGAFVPPSRYDKLSLFTFSVFCLNVLVLLYCYIAASYGYLELGDFPERENIPVEPLTAALYAGSGLTLFLAAAAARRGWLRWFYLLVGLGALFVAGEEVSWGQHIFGFATPEFLLLANDHQETNLHNTAAGPIIIFFYIAILTLCYVAPIAAFCVRKYRLGPLPLPSLWLAFFFALAVNINDKLSWQGIIYAQHSSLLPILGIFLGAALFARDKRLLMVVGAIIALGCSVFFMHGKFAPQSLEWVFPEVQEYLLGLAGFLYCLQLLRDSGGERWLAWRRRVKAAWFRTRGRATELLPSSDLSANCRTPGPDWARYSWWAWPAACLLVAGFATVGVAALDWQLAAAQGREYQRMTAAPPTAQAHSWNFYHTPGRLTYLKAGSCPRRANPQFFLHIVPVREDDLPAELRGTGFLSREFFWEPEMEPFRFPDGSCPATIPLPDYPIAQIITGQQDPWETQLWEVRLDLDANYYRAAYQPIAAGQAGPPLVRAEFDLYRYNNALYYFRESCAPADTAARFFLHLIPENPEDLPAAQQDLGFVNRDFDFNRRGHWFDGKCLAVVELPDYPISEIRTGQFTAAGTVWEVALPARN